MPYSPLLIANYFVQKALGEGNPVTPMKLMKLVYIAHGWNYVYNEDALLSEPVEAWKYGPVISSVYHAFKQYGAKPIDALAFPGPTDYQTMPDRVRRVLDVVWNSYKQFDGIQLSAITHQSNTPWYSAFNSHKSIIPNESIRNHYMELNARRVGA